jgi:hypothetical protein
MKKYLKNKWLKVLEFIPMTYRNNRKIQKGILKESIKLKENLKVLNSKGKIKKSVYINIKNTINAYSRIKYFCSLLDVLDNKFSHFTLRYWFIFSPFIFCSFFNVKLNLWLTLASMLTNYVFLGIIAIFIYYSIIKTKLVFLYFRTTVVLIILFYSATIGIVFYNYYLLDYKNIYTTTFLYIPVASFSFWLLVIVLTDWLIFIPLRWTYHRRLIYLYPYENLLMEYINLLYIFETKNDYVNEDKINVINILDTIIYIMQTSLYRLFRNCNKQTQIFMREYFTNASYLIMEYKNRISINGASELTKLKPDVEKYFNAICDYNWVFFEQKKDIKAIEKKSLFAKGLEKVKLLVVAFIPLIGLIILQHTNYALNSGICDYVKIGVFIWVIFVFLHFIDPQFLTKLEAFKSIATFIPSFLKTDNK